jgi:two-component system LytT family response regulator
MEIKAVIVDDEKHSLESTEILIRKFCPGIRITGLAASPEQGIELIDSLKPDLVFLDIAMPRLNGFELLQSLKYRDFDLIFTTAYNAYAIKAFRVNAIDYLLKPIEAEELVGAVEKVRRRMEDAKKLHSADHIIRNLEDLGMKRSRLALPVEGKIVMLDHEQIIYCESDGNYTRLFLTNGGSIMISRTLKDIDDMLQGPGFIRIHHSYLVNIRHVSQYLRGEGGAVILSNGIHLRVSRNRKKELLAALMQEPPSRQ